MILTREEQKSVVRMVMESYQGVTLTEARSNNDIKEEMKLNLGFYNVLKEDFKKDIPKELINEGEGTIQFFLGILGIIKDFMTGADELAGKGKSKISKIVQRFVAWIKSKVDKYISPYIPQGVKDVANKVGKFIKWLVKFISDTLSYKGLAKFFARIRYAGGVIKFLNPAWGPSEEQKKCMLPIAKKIYRWIIIGLVIAFVIKIVMLVFPVIAGAVKAGAVASKAAAAAAAKAGAVQTAGLGTTTIPALIGALGPIKAFLIKLGFKGVAMKIFGAFSAAEKHKKAETLKKDLEAYTEAEKSNLTQEAPSLWNYCPLPEKK